MDKSKAVNIHTWPSLTSPLLVAAWPGIGEVGLRATTYLRDKLGAERFAYIHPQKFFASDGCVVKNSVVQKPSLPQSEFYFWKNNEGEDLVIFVGEIQPTAYESEFAYLILDLAQTLGVKRVYTFAAALVPRWEENPQAWAVATEPSILAELEREEPPFQDSFYIGGMNGLLLAQAKEKGMEGVGILGETPQVAAKLPNPLAAAAILKKFKTIINIELDLKDIEAEAERARREIDELMQESRRQLIDQLTLPLWERGDETQN
jgi:hypothetical protein